MRIIDAEPGRPVTQTPIELTKGRPLAELRGTLDEVLARADEHRDEHLRVRLDVERPEPGIAERVREKLPNAVDVQLEYEALEEDASVEPIANLSAAELFTRYYQSQHGAAPEPALVGLFEELLAEGDEARAAETAAPS
ncbi:MAG: exonuclease SbcCD subunit D C-terminal domain-containing protein [Chloroflexi bacterium]|nr:exonuclease SbcCD subunit D C-terminal domain-containing protein [Chloroflexota bacterium]